MKKIYLAIPYTGMEEKSMEVSTRVAAHLTKLGHYVISPITMSHPQSLVGDLPSDWEYWKGLDTWLISCCEEVWIVDVGMTKILESTGVQAEIEIAKNFNMPIKFIDADTLVMSNYEDVVGLNLAQ